MARRAELRDGSPRELWPGRIVRVRGRRLKPGHIIWVTWNREVLAVAESLGGREARVLVTKRALEAIPLPELLETAYAALAEAYGCHEKPLVECASTFQRRGHADLIKLLSELLGRRRAEEIVMSRILDIGDAAAQVVLGLHNNEHDAPRRHPYLYEAMKIIIKRKLSLNNSR